MIYGNLRRHVTLPPIAERLPMEFLLPVLTTLRSVATGGRTSNSHMRGERSKTEPPNGFYSLCIPVTNKTNNIPELSLESAGITTYNEIT